MRSLLSLSSVFVALVFLFSCQVDQPESEYLQHLQSEIAFAESFLEQENGYVKYMEAQVLRLPQSIQVESGFIKRMKKKMSGLSGGEGKLYIAKWSKEFQLKSKHMKMTLVNLQTQAKNSDPFTKARETELLILLESLMKSNPQLQWEFPNH